MQITQNRTILLISSNAGRFESLSLFLQQIGYNILSAVEGREGFRLTRRSAPDLVICEMNLAGISALELCRMIRADRELWATPLMFVSESSLDSKTLIEILDAGADECLAEFSNPQYLAAKAGWLIKRKYSENYLIQNYETLRRRQMPITQIIKDTANLFVKSDLEYKTGSLNEFNTGEFEKNLSQRINLGMNMIGALANLLEDQMNALATGGSSQRRDEFITEPESDAELSELNYEYVTNNFMEDDLPAQMKESNYRSDYL